MNISNHIFKLSLFLVVFLSILQRYIITSLSYTHDVLKPKFIKSFRDSCLKYPFVQSHYHRLTHSTGETITFIFQQDGLNCGGVGDRLAGLVNVVSLSIRYNRTVIIRSVQADIYSLFEPYVPPEHEHKHRAHRFSYHPEKLSWTRYSKSNNDNNNEDMELLLPCINRDDIQAVENCSLVHGNPKQKHIIYQGNRAFLCRFYNSKNDSPEKKFITEILGEGNDDLFEAAGCMLRLVMWPTEVLWRHIEELIDSYYNQSTYELQLSENSNSNNYHLKHHHIHNHNHSNWKYLIGLHFRCGDIGYENQTLSKSDKCLHSYEYMIKNNKNKTMIYSNYPTHSESKYMSFGSPIDMAVCANSLLYNISSNDLNAWSESFQEEINHLTQEHVLVPYLDSTHISNHIESIIEKVAKFPKIRTNALIYLMSDNFASLYQMNDTLKWPNTFIVQSSCHVDFNDTFECLHDTMSSWLVLSLSDYLVTQTYDSKSVFSGFSRYAYIYGLQQGGLRDARDCDNFLTRRDHSHRAQNTWWC